MSETGRFQPMSWSLWNEEQIVITRRSQYSTNFILILKKKKAWRILSSCVSTWTSMQKRTLHLSSDFSVTVCFNFPRWCVSPQLHMLLYYSYYSYCIVLLLLQGLLFDSFEWLNCAGIFLYKQYKRTRLSVLLLCLWGNASETVPSGTFLWKTRPLNCLLIL